MSTTETDRFEVRARSRAEAPADHWGGMGGVTYYDSAWRKCRSCGDQEPEMTPLCYTRSDGVKGMSGEMCWDCKPEQIWRLQRSGFTMDSGHEPPPWLSERQRKSFEAFTRAGGLPVTTDRDVTS